jgi:glycosyltransferase involved in cell wall biosynthesis
MRVSDLENLDVCFVAGTLGKGGAEQQLYYMLRALRAAGSSARVLTLTRGEYWEARIRELGVPVTWVGARASRLGRLGAIVAELRDRRPDILQSQHFFANLYVVGAARALRLREICAIRNDVFSEVAANGRVLGRMSLRIPRAIVANSRAAIGNAVRLGVPPSRLHLVPNVVDVERFQRAEHPRGSTVTLVAVGRMKRAKRFDRFVRLLARLRAEQPAFEVRGLIAGEGPEEERLRALAVELRLGADILEFCGPVDDMPSFYSRGDLFVLTSDWEGTPNVVLEAMAAGLPVVATAAGGVPEVVADGDTGFVVAPADEDGLANRAATLIADPDLRRLMAARARRHVEGAYSLSRLPARLGEIYAAALS